MRPIDVGVHSREPVGETLRYKTLRREMITLIKILFAEDMEDAGVAFQARGVQLDSIQQMGNPAEPAVGVFYCDAAYYAVHFVPFSQQMLSQITTVLPSNTSNKRAFSAHCFPPVCPTYLTAGSGRVWWVMNAPAEIGAGPADLDRAAAVLSLSGSHRGYVPGGAALACLSRPANYAARLAS